MASGGVRARGGRPPDPNALRRDRLSDAGWTVLPAEGRAGPAPEWPLTEASAREAALWSALWAKPQALLWERNQQAFEVALHVRCLAEAETAGAATSLRTLVRQQADALLLTMPAMHMTRVRIAGDELGERRPARPPAAGARPVGPSARERLRALDAPAPP